MRVAVSCLGVAMFVVAIRWQAVTVLQRFIPIRLRRRPRVSENSTQETPQDDVK